MARRRRPTSRASKNKASFSIMSPQPEFRVLDTENVLITTTPDGDGAPAAACAVPLTFFDVKWLHLPPVERVLLYRLQPDADAAAIVASLKSSLSHALRAFFPLAGRVRLIAAPGGTGGRIRHELFYQPGDGVPFTTAEYDADVDDLAGAADGDGVPVAAVAPLAPPLPAGRAVLAVQATTLLRRRGIALGVTIHHSACDGRSSTRFLHTWASAAAAAATGGSKHLMPAAKVIDDPPVIDADRKLVTDPRGLYHTYLNAMPPIARSPDLEFVRSKQPSPGGDDVAVATFTLSAEALQGVRSAVAREAARRGEALSPRCSPLVAAYGLMWWCHVHAVKKQSASNNNDYYFLFSVDQRARLKPAPLPDRYFGNCMCPAIATVPRDEMAVSVSDDGGDAVATIGGLYAACAAVAAAIEEEAGENAQEEGRWDGCVARVKRAVANGTLSVAGSPRFRVYGLDFGFGRPVKVHMVSVAKAGAVAVADARAGGRGLELGVALPPDAMGRFRGCFAKAMDACLIRE